MSLFPMVNPAKKKLAEGGLVLCMGIRQARTVDILMVAAQCGFDSFYVDMEHSPVSHETAAALCAGSLGLGVCTCRATPWLRAASASIQASCPPPTMPMEASPSAAVGA